MIDFTASCAQWVENATLGNIPNLEGAAKSYLLSLAAWGHMAITSLLYWVVFSSFSSYQIDSKSANATSRDIFHRSPTLNMYLSHEEIRIPELVPHDWLDRSISILVIEPPSRQLFTQASSPAEAEMPALGRRHFVAITVDANVF